MSSEMSKSCEEKNKKKKTNLFKHLILQIRYKSSANILQFKEIQIIEYGNIYIVFIKMVFYAKR